MLVCLFSCFWQIEWIYFIGLQIFFTLPIITYLLWPAAVITRQKKKVWIHVATTTATEKYHCFYKYSLKRFNFSRSVGKEAYFRGNFPPSHPFNSFPNGSRELDVSHSASQILFSALIFYWHLEEFVEFTIPAGSLKTFNY